LVVVRKRLGVAALVGLILTAMGLVGAGMAGQARADEGPGEAPPAYRTKHVIVAVMDGVRYSETFGDPEHRLVPRMWTELAPQGTLYTGFYNRGVTVTRQGHSTIASGTYQVVPNGGARLTRPTFFDYFREETGAPADQAWAIFGKGDYSFAPYSSCPTYQDRWAPRATIGVGENSLEDDRKVLETALSVMREHQPRLMFLNFGYTDHIGHLGTFDEYTRAVTNVDALFADLWAAIQADPEYRDSTTLILTNDHGRHDDAHGGFHGHGDGDEGCRHVFFLVLGPDTRQGAVVADPAEQIDIAPTVGELLGFQTPLAEGRVLSESFRSSLGLNRKAARTAVEKAAVHTLELAGRDLGRTVSHQALLRLSPATLPANPASALLFHGLLTRVKTGQPPESTLVLQAVRDWLEKTRDDQGKAALYRTLVLLDLPRPETAAVRQYLETADSTAPGWTEVDRAFFLDLVARSGELTRLEPALQAVLTSANAPAPALTLYALSDALAALENPKRPGPPQSGLGTAVAKLKEACLLRYYRAAQDQVEAGGLWPDPVDSLLYLAAADRLDAAGLFRDFQPAKKLGRGKEQNEQVALPALVADLSPATIAAWTKPGDPGKAKAPRRRMAALIWETNRYLAFSRELARYLVDEAGQVKGDDQALADGAFLTAQPMRLM
jgi:hypothetical protein